MGSELKNFFVTDESSREAGLGGKPLRGVGAKRREVLWLQVVLGYLLIEAALWTPPGHVDALWMAAAVVCLAWWTIGGDFSAKEMGLALPTAKASAWIVLGGLILAGLVPALAAVLGDNTGAKHMLPFHSAWQYALWAVDQEFILQSFFFVRLESLLGSRRAVAVAAVVFAAAHIPSPILAFTSLFGALFFCEMFRRYRNIFPLGAVHAALGLIIAASFSDAALHHMRVGIGYVRFHP